MNKHTFLLILSFVTFSGTLKSQSGALDLTFGVNGVASTTVGTLRDDAQDMVIDQNGKIVVVGFSEVTLTNFDFSVARFNANGTLDATFGTGGKTIINTGSGGDEAYSVAIDASGRIYIAGLIWNGVVRNLGIVRLTAAGLPDNTWDGDGIWISGTPYGEYINDIAIDPTGKIVIAGHGGLNDDRIVVIRMTTSATYDGTFGTGGRMEFGSNSNSDGMAIAFDSNNKIILGAKDEFVIYRINTNGTLDATFGSGGSITVNPTINTDDLSDIAVDGSGNIVAVGHGGPSLQADYIAVRVTSSGVVDNTFGTAGVSIISGGIIQDNGQAVAISSTGKIIIAGSSSDATGTFFSVVRLNANGTPDNSFGTSGVAIVSGTNANNGFGIGLNATGNIIVAGIGDGGPNNDFFVIRLLSSATSGIAEMSQVQGRIYPNPANESFKLSLENEQDFVLTVYDVTGKEEFNMSLVGQKEYVLDVSRLTAGVYYVIVRSAAGNEVYKLVKM
jgi:uncharacterized delta-60 repeat protein